MTKIALNIGKKQQISKGDILGAVANETGIGGQKIGLIEVYEKISFVDVPAENARTVVEKMSRTRIKGFNIKAEIVQ
jgi:ATP-dependent RNA helicase DeaD